jgi:hypothetical protein
MSDPSSGPLLANPTRLNINISELGASKPKRHLGGSSFDLRRLIILPGIELIAGVAKTVWISVTVWSLAYSDAMPSTNTWAGI